MFRSVRFYSVSSPWPESEQALSELLSGAAFAPCAAYAERSAGFEAPAGDDDAPLARRVGGVDLLRLRSQARVLPAAAIAEALEVRLDEYRQRMRQEPGRRVRRQLKDQTRDELLPKALLKSERTTAVYVAAERVLAVGVASPTRAERFCETLRAALGKLDLKPLEHARPVADLLVRIFAGETPAKFALGRECRMRDRADAKSTVRWQDSDLSQAIVRKCLKDGMEITHLGVEFAGVMTAVVAADGVLGKLRLLGLDEPPADDGEDPLARLDAELTLLGGTLRQWLASVRTQLGG